MFRNDPGRNGRADGPGPGDSGKIEEIWSFDAGGDVESSPAVVDGKIVIGNSDGTLYCLGSKSNATDKKATENAQAAKK